uniref:type II toxin-antitoxin system PemK/MazF family toxin n=1 Tax=Enterocloster clostridioformis TaxID=1531 RepID=UPI001C3CEF16|nr:type II toxin-antitoxin system PemK/MazF family toxin [Enterocloster clostridioformis]
MSKTYLRGDLYYADLNRCVGSEQEGNRPVVIIQNDVGNKYSPTVIVAAITSQAPMKAKLPTHCYVDAESGLERPSIILLEQIRTIDKRRLGRYIGRLTKERIEEMDHALAVSLDLRCPTSEAIVMSLCGICADNFRHTGAYFLCRLDPRQIQKEVCTYCNQRRGFDYVVVKKEERK